MENNIVKKSEFILDNSFSVRFKTKKQLNHAPNCIYMVSLPDFCVYDTDYEVDSQSQNLIITFRGTKEQLLEEEIYGQLLHEEFDVEVSLFNSNKIDFEFLGCSVSKIGYSPLMNRGKQNYFNISIHLKSKTNKIHYMNNTLVSGDVPVNYMDLIDDKKGRNDEV